MNLNTARQKTKAFLSKKCGDFVPNDILTANYFNMEENDYRDTLEDKIGTRLAIDGDTELSGIQVVESDELEQQPEAMAVSLQISRSTRESLKEFEALRSEFHSFLDSKSPTDSAEAKELLQKITPNYRELFFQALIAAEFTSNNELLLRDMIKNPHFLKGIKRSLTIHDEDTVDQDYWNKPNHASPSDKGFKNHPAYYLLGLGLALGDFADGIDSKDLPKRIRNGYKALNAAIKRLKDTVRNNAGGDQALEDARRQNADDIFHAICYQEGAKQGYFSELESKPFPLKYRLQGYVALKDTPIPFEIPDNIREFCFRHIKNLCDPGYEIDGNYTNVLRLARDQVENQIAGLVESAHALPPVNTIKEMAQNNRSRCGKEEKRIKIFEAYQEFLRELAPDLGITLDSPKHGK